MSTSAPAESSELIGVNPHAFDEKLLVKKDPKSIAELRASFSKKPCSVLSQVKDFLPKMASANNDLSHRIASDPSFSADIEHVEEDQSYIEMNIAMFEQDAIASDSSDSESGEETVGEITEHNMKLHKHRRKGDNHGPLIECVEQSNSSLVTEVNKSSVGSSSEM